MSQPIVGPERDMLDLAPGDERPEGSGVAQGLWAYIVGLALAGGLTAMSFYVGLGHIVWPPAVVAAISVLAIAQMGVHLVFFLHVTSGPDSTNNVLALAFGVLIVFLVLVGTIWITSALNHQMLPMDKIMEMQR